MDLLTILLLIPGITLLFLFLARGQAAIRWVAVTGGAIQLFYTVFLAYCFIQEKMMAGNTGALLFTNSFNWFKLQLRNRRHLASDDTAYGAGRIQRHIGIRQYPGAVQRILRLTHIAGIRGLWLLYSHRPVHAFLLP